MGQRSRAGAGAGEEADGPQAGQPAQGNTETETLQVTEKCVLRLGHMLDVCPCMLTGQGDPHIHWHRVWGQPCSGSYQPWEGARGLTQAAEHGASTQAAAHG